MATTISYYGRPDELWSLNGAVADTVGTTDSDYTNEWLADARVGRPARSSVGSITWTVTNPAAFVDFICVANHSVNPARSITIGGSLAASLTVPSVVRTNGIPRNPFTTVNSASVTTMTVSVMANSMAVNAKLYAGHLRAFPRAGFLVEGLSDTLRGPQVKTGFIQAFDSAESSPRVFQGVVRCNDAQVSDMLALYDSQKNGSLPAILIPDINTNDARVTYLDAPNVARDGLFWKVSLSFTEYPQVRW